MRFEWEPAGGVSTTGRRETCRGAYLVPDSRNQAPVAVLRRVGHGWQRTRSTTRISPFDFSLAMAVTANTGTAGIAANGIRTLKLDWPHRNELDAESPLVALGRTGDEFVLVVADEKKRDERPYDTFITALSVMVNEDPFPGWSMENRQMIWSVPSLASTPPPLIESFIVHRVKTYSENDGLLPQLEKAGWSRP